MLMIEIDRGDHLGDIGTLSENDTQTRAVCAPAFDRVAGTTAVRPGALGLEGALLQHREHLAFVDLAALHAAGTMPGELKGARSHTFLEALWSRRTGEKYEQQHGIPGCFDEHGPVACRLEFHP